MKTKQHDKPSRRRFLQTAAMVAGGAALAAPASAVAAQPAATAKSTASRGYQKSAHVRRYYQLARDV